MLTQYLKPLFQRDLMNLKKEISAYSNEEIIWKIEGNISNSAGNLCLHLVGNLNHFIGAVLGETGYIRKREEEFSLKGLPVSSLVEEVENTLRVVNNVLDNLTAAQVEEEYPIVLFMDKMTTGLFLVHLYGHLNYHLGQINYHRRLLDVD
ncbi:MAG: DUF1572 family protein [Saprospiraceae bacterium]|nr:DUF1572 family protein [Saprospiraceae bacterium]